MLRYLTLLRPRLTLAQYELKMENEIKLSLKQAILKLLPRFDELSQQYQRPRFVWSKVDDHWEGEEALRPSLIDVFMASRSQITSDIFMQWCVILINTGKKSQANLLVFFVHSFRITNKRFFV
jgi:hypothetical protein